MVKGRKGSIAIYFSFIVVAILVVVIAAVLAPLGVLINTEFYAVGEDILLEANDSIANINDPTVRTNVYDMIDKGFDAQENNIEINADIFQYSWIFVIILSGVVVFMFTRRIVEIQGGGFI